VLRSRADLVRRLSPLTLAFCFLVSVALAGAQSSSAPAGERTLVDRVVAVVDEDPILLSDVERAIGLGMIRAEPGESAPALRRRVLDRLIEERLRLHEILRFGLEEAPLAEVGRQVERLRARFPSEEAWQAELARLGLDEGRVRQILARQLAVLTYVEQRLGPRVFVGVEEIQRYYDETLVPRLLAEGEPAPPVEEVREAIRALLREERMNVEVERWTRQLRREADVVDLLDADDRPLPPVVHVIGEPPV
jgi:hypothetical protein